jgi:hypothetical protein
MTSLSYRGHDFPAVIIQHAIWLSLSYRDVEERFAQARSVDVRFSAAIG